MFNFLIKFKGKGIYYYNNGSKYEGDWIDNKKCGHGRIDFVDGAWYEGNFRNGVFHGFGTYHYSSNGSTFAGQWLNGSKINEN